MRKRRLALKITSIPILATLAACGMDEQGGADFDAFVDNLAPEVEEADDLAWVDELKLTPVLSPAGCATTGTGTKTLALAATGESVVVYLHATTGNLMVNATSCVASGDLGTFKTLTITGGAGADTVVVDYQNGDFLAGSGTGPGLVFNAALPITDSFRMRGGTGAEDIVWGLDTGTLKVESTGDSNVDITVTGAEVFTVALSDGDDYFNAQGSGITGATAVTTAISVNGGAGADWIIGGDGADTISGVAGEDDLEGRAGNDTLGGGDDNDTILGGAGNDTMTGGSHSDDLYGDDGDDVFSEELASNGDDTFYGGNGTDTVTYASRTAAIHANMGDAAASDGAGAAATATITITSVADDDNISLDNGPGSPVVFEFDNDASLGGAPSNTAVTITAVGSSGAATAAAALALIAKINLTPSAGFYAYTAGDGVVSLVGTRAGTGAAQTDSGTGITVSLADGSVSEGDDIQDDVEKIIGSSTAANVLFGNDADNDMTGGAAADIIAGGAGNDTITGGLLGDNLFGDAGGDTFLEGAVTNGGDVFTGGAGTDQVYYGLRTAALTVTMNDNAANDGLAGELDNIRSDVEDCVGGSGADVITGNDSANSLDGLGGNDTLNGGPGDDIIDGGAGTDIANGGDGDADICVSETRNTCEV